MPSCRRLDVLITSCVSLPETFVEYVDNLRLMLVSKKIIETLHKMPLYFLHERRVELAACRLKPANVNSQLG